MAIKVNGTTVIQDSPRAITNLETALSVAQGGTGQTTYTDGQLLIGNTTGNTLAKATLTQGVGLSITNGAGSISIAMGTPSTLTTSTTNSANGTTHTHEVTFPVTSVASKTGAVTLAAADVGLGTSSSVQFGSFGVGTAASGTSGEIRATNNITAYFSDDRLKTRLGYIENALEKVCSLSGFYYQANEEAQKLGYEPIREVGVSAQEVQKVLPEIVVPAPIDDRYLTVRYEKIIPLLIEAIKEIKQELNTLKGK